MKFKGGDKITLNTGYQCDTGTFVRHEGNKVVWEDEDGKIYKSDQSKYNIKLVSTNYLKLDTKFVSLNEYIDAERASKWKGANIKKQQTNAVHYLCREQKFKLKPELYDVLFIWHKPDNRKDHDNIAFAKKFILDGIVDAGAIPKDNSNYINNFWDVFILDKSRKYVWCEIKFTLK